jgi:hypothetical protein
MFRERVTDIHVRALNMNFFVDDGIAHQSFLSARFSFIGRNKQRRDNLVPARLKRSRNPPSYRQHR